MKEIICIFCGQKADIIKDAELSKAVCAHCNRETELVEYNKMVALWLKSLGEMN